MRCLLLYYLLLICCGYALVNFLNVIFVRIHVHIFLHINRIFRRVLQRRNLEQYSENWHVNYGVMSLLFMYLSGCFMLLYTIYINSMYTYVRTYSWRVKSVFSHLLSLYWSRRKKIDSTSAKLIACFNCRLNYVRAFLAKTMTFLSYIYLFAYLRLLSFLQCSVSFGSSQVNYNEDESREPIK